jgi:hypothetical protein
MPAVTKVDAPNKARLAANLRIGNVSLAVDRLNVTRRSAQTVNPTRHIVAKPVAKSAVSVVRQPNIAPVQRSVKTAKVVGQQAPRITSGKKFSITISSNVLFVIPRSYGRRPSIGRSYGVNTFCQVSEIQQSEIQHVGFLGHKVGPDAGHQFHRTRCSVRVSVRLTAVNQAVDS